MLELIKSYSENYLDTILKKEILTITKSLII